MSATTTFWRKHSSIFSRGARWAFVPGLGAIAGAHPLLLSLVCLVISAWGASTGIRCSHDRTSRAEGTLPSTWAIWTLAARHITLFTIAYWLSLEYTHSSPEADHPALLLLGPASSFLTGAILGATIGRFTSRSSVALVAFTMVVLASIALGLWGYYWSPVFYAYDPFVGYVSAATATGHAHYDHGLYLRYRVIVLAVASFVFVTLEYAAHKGTLARNVLACILASSLVLLRSPMGQHHGRFSSSHDDIVDWLGATTASGSVELAYDIRKTPRQTAGRWQGELEFAIRRTSARLAPVDDGSIIVYLFATEQDKQDLLGSGRAEYAKPWTSQLFLSLDRMTNTIAHHEVAHILVARRFGAGRRLHLGTNPLIDEGLAVALGPSDTIDAGLHERAKIVLELSPSLRLTELAGLGFWRDPDVSYAIAGSFLSWLVEVHGLDAAGELYRTNGGFVAVLGRSLDELQGDWSSWMDAHVEVGARARRVTEYELAHLAAAALACDRTHAEAASRAWAQGRFTRAAELHGEDCQACRPSSEIPCVDEAWARAFAGNRAAASEILSEIDESALPSDYRLVYADAKSMSLSTPGECSESALRAAEEAVLAASSAAWQTWFLLRYLACVLPAHETRIDDHLRTSQLAYDNPMRRLEHSPALAAIEDIGSSTAARKDVWVLHLLAGLDLYGRGAFLAASRHLGAAATFPAHEAGRFAGLLRYKILDHRMRAQAYGGSAVDARETLARLATLEVPDELIGVIDVTTWRERLDHSITREDPG
jgi:hypothetical protein